MYGGASLPLCTVNFQCLLCTVQRCFMRGGLIAHVPSLRQCKRPLSPRGSPCTSRRNKRRRKKTKKCVPAFTMPRDKGEWRPFVHALVRGVVYTSVSASLRLIPYRYGRRWLHHLLSFRLVHCTRARAHTHVLCSHTSGVFPLSAPVFPLCCPPRRRCLTVGFRCVSGERVPSGLSKPGSRSAWNVVSRFKDARFCRSESKTAQGERPGLLLDYAARSSDSR